MKYCYICFKVADEDHHVTYRSHGGGEEENLLPLCHKCHRTGKQSIHNGGIVLRRNDEIMKLEVWIKGSDGILRKSKSIPYDFIWRK